MGYLCAALIALCLRLWHVNRKLAFQVEVWNMIADKRMTDEEREEMEADIRDEAVWQ